MNRPRWLLVRPVGFSGIPIAAWVNTATIKRVYVVKDGVDYWVWLTLQDKERDFALEPFRTKEAALEGALMVMDGSTTVRDRWVRVRCDGHGETQIAAWVNADSIERVEIMKQERKDGPLYWVRLATHEREQDDALEPFRTEDGAKHAAMRIMEASSAEEDGSD